MTISATTTSTRAGDPLAILQHHAGDPGLLGRLDLCGTERSWERIETDQGVELWLIAWPAGTSTGWHDHGTAAGAFTTLVGTLTEYTWDGVVHARTLGAGAGRSFGSDHRHDVVNHAAVPALSLHAYAPQLVTMTRYELVRGHLEVVGVEAAGSSR